MTKILIVDDDQMIRWLYARESHREGYEIDMAGSGFEAIRKTRVSRPDCVVMDLLMDEMDGMETMEHLHEIDETIPVILCSGCYDLEESFEESDAFAVLHKSLDLTRLRQTVADAIKARKTTSTVKAQPCLV